MFVPYHHPPWAPRADPAVTEPPGSRPGRGANGSASTSSAATGLDGRTLTTAGILDGVQADGLILVIRGRLERLDDGRWAADLESAASTRGLRLTIEDMGRVVLVHDGDLPAPSLGADPGPSNGPDSPEPANARWLESWNAHPSQQRHLRLLPGGKPS